MSPAALVLGFVLFVPDPIAEPSFGGKELHEALVAELGKSVKALVPVARKSEADFELRVVITKTGWRYSAHAQLLSMRDGAKRMDFTSDYYVPGTESADRGLRIARTTITKLQQLAAAEPPQEVHAAATATVATTPAKTSTAAPSGLASPAPSSESSTAGLGEPTTAGTAEGSPSSSSGFGDASASHAEDLGYTLHGFVLAQYVARATGKSFAGRARDFIFAEERGRLELNLETSVIDAGARLELDAAHDAIDGTVAVDVREAYIDYRGGPFDLRIGRQVLTWGTGDLVFVNDLFPKDYSSFFQGRPIEYLKVPNDALRTTLTLGSYSAEVAAIPFFTADVFPRPDRFIYGFDPFPMIAARQIAPPQTRLRNVELAGRIYGPLLGLDFALYAFRGFFHSPSITLDDPAMPAALTYVFPELSVYGASLQGNLLGGIFNLEGGYYDSRDDRDGNNPFVPNSSVRGLAGFQLELVPELTIGLQYLGELTLQYDGRSPPDRYRQTATLRVMAFLLNQSLRISLFAFIGITEQDFLIVPELEYKIFDRLSVVLGGNIFAGKDPFTSFGIFRDDSNVYTWMRFSF